MEIEYPDLKTRVQSIFIDTVLMIILMFLAGWILDKINPGQEEEDGWVRALIFISIWGIYEPVAMTIGCTLGNYLMKIRARRFDNVERKINLFQAYARFIVKMLLGWLSFLTISMNNERRAIHDFAGGSVMISN
jgi:uncharacterized membrane protein YeaQ/YmgE (transglycosylase-associated protein family)